jgi:hypothetical protein
VKRRFWTALDDAELRDLYPHLKTEKVAALIGRSLAAVYGRADILGLRKTAIYLASPDACRLRRDENPGIRYRYPKGHVPANKGLRRPGYAPGRMAQTQFRKGQRNGTAAAHYMPLGATRLSKDGYLLIKVAEVPNVFQNINWKLLHVINWERANGRPLPAGHCLVFRDGNKLNAEASNLDLITRAENMRRNTYHRYPKVIARAIQMRGALNRRINRLERERAEHA